MMNFRQVFGVAGKRCVLLAGLLTAVSPASAFEFNPYHADTVGQVSWTGFIFNPSLSYDTFEFSGRGGRFLKDSEGLRVGAEIGYDRQIGSVVVGFAGDIFKSWADGGRERAAPTRLNSEVDVHGTLRGRLGYSFGRFMAYGTGGLAFARVRVSDDTARTTDVQTMTGWAGGGGLEYVYNNRFTIRAEYLHKDYGDASFSSLPAGARELNPTQDQISVGFVTRF